MKHIISNLVASVLLLCLISCGMSNEKALSSNGSLKAESRIFKFGKIERTGDKNKPFYFELNNESDTIIEIQKIDVSCGCLNINDYPETIEPRSTVTLEGFIDLSDINGFFEKVIYIKYKESKLLLLRVMGEVKNK